MEPTGEIISIGNELLIGHTLDTNSHWLAIQLNRRGWVPQRVTQLRDSLDSIASGVREAVLRKPLVLITLGGLGPTYDDMTLAGIAREQRSPTARGRALSQTRDPAQAHEVSDEDGHTSPRGHAPAESCWHSPRREDEAILHDDILPARCAV